MANLTLVIDDNVLKRARMKAAEAGTSVNAVVRDHLSRWMASTDARAAAARALIASSERARSRRGRRRWTRDDLHQR